MDVKRPHRLLQFRPVLGQFLQHYGIVFKIGTVLFQYSKNCQVGTGRNAHGFACIVAQCYIRLSFAIDFVKATAMALLLVKFPGNPNVWLYDGYKLALSAFIGAAVIVNSQFWHLKRKASSTLFLGAALAIRGMPCHKPIRDGSIRPCFLRLIKRICLMPG